MYSTRRGLRDTIWTAVTRCALIRAGAHLGLEGAPQSHDKGVLGKSKNVPLKKHLLHLFLHHHPMLADFLHRKTFPGLSVADQVDRTVGWRLRKGNREKIERER